MWVVAGIHRPSAGLQQSSSRVVRFISRENRSTGWQPETDRTRLSSFIAWIRPPLLQLESTSEFGKTTKKRAANLCVFVHLQQASQASSAERKVRPLPSSFSQFLSLTDSLVKAQAPAERVIVSLRET
jgi:hypothetical protein